MLQSRETIPSLVVIVCAQSSVDTAMELNRKGLMLPSRFSDPFFFLFSSFFLCVCANSLKGIVYPLAVKSTPHTGSSSPKGAVRSSRLPSLCRRTFITSLDIYMYHMFHFLMKKSRKGLVLP